MRQTFRQYKWVWLLIAAFLLGQGASLLQAQVGVSPGRYRFGSTIAPSTNDGAALGTTALGWSDLHLATGAVINWANGEVTITETDANTLTLAGSVFLVPAGTVAAPSLANSAEAATGIFFATGNIRHAFAGGNTWYFASGALRGYNNSDVLSFGSSDDIILGRDAAAALQFGVDSATPIAQTLKGPDARAGTDTDTAGGNMTLGAGTPTGTGTPGKVIISQSIKGAATGTAASPRMTVASFGASGGHYMMPELLADPSSTELTSQGEVAIYSKSDKAVIAVNRSGIVWFLTIPLDGVTTTWSWSTAAP